jgi:hypothetical protein
MYSICSALVCDLRKSAVACKLLVTDCERKTIVLDNGSSLRVHPSPSGRQKASKVKAVVTNSTTAGVNLGKYKCEASDVAADVAADAGNIIN